MYAVFLSGTGNVNFLRYTIPHVSLRRDRSSSMSSAWLVSARDVLDTCTPPAPSGPQQISFVTLCSSGCALRCDVQVLHQLAPDEHYCHELAQPSAVSRNPESVE